MSMTVSTTYSARSCGFFRCEKKRAQRPAQRKDEQRKKDERGKRPQGRPGARPLETNGKNNHGDVQDQDRQAPLFQQGLDIVRIPELLRMFTANPTVMNTRPSGSSRRKAS